MEGIPINLEGADFEAMEAGEYAVSVSKVEATRSQAGDQMLVFELALIEPPYQGRKLWLRHLTVGQGRAYLKRTLMALGFTKEELGANFVLRPEEIVGEEAIAVVGQRVIEQGDFKGEVGNEVRRLRPA